MTTDMLKDLAEVVQRCEVDHSLAAGTAVAFVRTYHTTIQQNAEAALRLRALEQALDTWAAHHADHASYANHLIAHADEILREWKENAK